VIARTACCGLLISNTRTSRGHAICLVFIHVLTIFQCYHWPQRPVSHKLIPDPKKLVAEVAATTDEVALKLWPTAHEPELCDHIVLSAIIVRSYTESRHKLGP
jgi:hypothetical protein